MKRADLQNLRGKSLPSNCMVSWSSQLLLSRSKGCCKFRAVAGVWQGRALWCWSSGIRVPVHEKFDLTSLHHQGCPLTTPSRHDARRRPRYAAEGFQVQKKADHLELPCLSCPIGALTAQSDFLCETIQRRAAFLAVRVWRALLTAWGQHTHVQMIRLLCLHRGRCHRARHTVCVWLAGA